MENQVNNQEETVIVCSKQEALEKFEALLDSQANEIAGGSPPKYEISTKISYNGGLGEVGFKVSF
jgi:hypothetical protein